MLADRAKGSKVKINNNIPTENHPTLGELCPGTVFRFLEITHLTIYLAGRENMDNRECTALNNGEQMTYPNSSRVRVFQNAEVMLDSSKVPTQNEIAKQLLEIFELFRERNRVKCIKKIRDLAGLPLRESKDLHDILEMTIKEEVEKKVNSADGY